MTWRILGLAGALCLFSASPLPALEGFESGLGAWSVNGLWHRVTSPACVTPHAGAACLYFGLGGACNYDDHNIKDASVTAGPVTLTSASTAFISFWMCYQVESDSPACYDELRLEISYDGVNWALLQKLSPSADPPGSTPITGFASGSGLGGAPEWLFRRVDLSAYLGLSIYLRFHFLSSGHQAGEFGCNSTDATYDNFLGYGLDDINFAQDPEPVGLAKSVSPPYGAPGAALTYTLVATNRDSVARDLSVWDTLPPGAVFGSATPPGVLNGNEVDWSLPATAGGASITLNLVVSSAGTEPLPQDWFNTAHAQSSAVGLSATSVSVLYRLRSPGLSLRKSVNVPETTNGDEVTYTLIAENFSPYSPVTPTALVLQEAPPGGFLSHGSVPAIDTANARWSLGALWPGQAASFELYGSLFANDGQTLVNNAYLVQGGAVVAASSASVKVNKPIEPQVWLRGIYPNPAPGDNGAFDPVMHIAYELNQNMTMTIDIFTVAGEKVRSLPVPSVRGTHEAVWDLKNAWGLPVASGVYAIRVWGDAKVRPYPEALGFGAVLR